MIYYPVQQQHARNRKHPNQVPYQLVCHCGLCILRVMLHPCSHHLQLQNEDIHLEVVAKGINLYVDYLCYQHKYSCILTSVWTVHRQGQPFTGLSSVNSMQYPNRTSSGAIVTNETAEAAINDPLIGRKVMTRWPEDDNFYEAVITNYNPIEVCSRS